MVAGRCATAATRGSGRSSTTSTIRKHPGRHHHLELRGEAGQHRLDVAFVQVLEEPADELRVFHDHPDTSIAAWSLSTACPRLNAGPGIRRRVLDGAHQSIDLVRAFVRWSPKPIRRGRKCCGVS
jgi:hypothetical protein